MTEIADRAKRDNRNGASLVPLFGFAPFNKTRSSGPLVLAASPLVSRHITDTACKTIRPPAGGGHRRGVRPKRALQSVRWRPRISMRGSHQGAASTPTTTKMASTSKGMRGVSQPRVQAATAGESDTNSHLCRNALNCDQNSPRQHHFDMGY